MAVAHAELAKLVADHKKFEERLNVLETQSSNQSKVMTMLTQAILLINGSGPGAAAAPLAASPNDIEPESPPKKLKKVNKSSKMSTMQDKAMFRRSRSTPTIKKPAVQRKPRIAATSVRASQNDAFDTYGGTTFRSMAEEQLSWLFSTNNSALSRSKKARPTKRRAKISVDVAPMATAMANTRRSRSFLDSFPFVIGDKVTLKDNGASFRAIVIDTKTHAMGLPSRAGDSANGVELLVKLRFDGREPPRKASPWYDVSNVTKLQGA